jgi:protein-disulfide isomerase
MPLRRRDFLASAAVLLAVFGGPPLWRRAFPSFDFVPLDGFPGFRKLDQGPVSTGPIALIGLDAPDPSIAAEQAELLKAPCNALYGAHAPDQNVPVAVFSDYNCPYCFVLSERLIRLQEGGAPIRLVWYELPLLGDRSDRSAKAALAAAEQGQYVAAHRYLMRKVLPPGPVGLRQMAQELGLDADRLTRDVDGEPVANGLRKSKVLASALGVIGTPATVIGRTLVLGAISPADLDHLIALETQDGPFDCLN